MTDVLTELFSVTNAKCYTLANSPTEVESRVQANGSTHYIVEGPGGVIIIQEDNAGNLSGRLRSGYVLIEGSEQEIIARAVEAVLGLGQDRSPMAAEEAE